LKNESIRNLAIIAHVDHGKTTLVDVMLRQSGIFRENQIVEERVMDKNDLEKERGITILSKNLSITYDNLKINIIDTPGHADFGGEVERVLCMVDSVLLLVDAFDGPMPQTRFVLKKSLDLGLSPIVVVNKIDRPGARPEAVVDMVFDLFCELNATDEQLDFPVVFASAKLGIAQLEADDQGENLDPLFRTIIEKVPAPEGNSEAPLQMLVNAIDYNDYLGRIATGRIFQGTMVSGSQVTLIGRDGVAKLGKITKILGFSGLGQDHMDSASAGDIVGVAGFDEVSIGNTICSPEKPEALPYTDIDEPTLAMHFMVNTSPFAGTEGKYVTSRHLRDRLQRELRTNVSLRVEDTDQMDMFKVSGRGELHLSILIENMRREGYELAVSKPEVIYREIDGVRCEPIEYLTIDVPLNLLYLHAV